MKQIQHIKMLIALIFGLLVILFMVLGLHYVALGLFIALALFIILEVLVNAYYSIRDYIKRK